VLRLVVLSTSFRVSLIPQIRENHKKQHRVYRSTTVLQDLNLSHLCLNPYSGRRSNHTGASASDCDRPKVTIQHHGYLSVGLRFTPYIYIHSRMRRRQAPNLHSPSGQIEREFVSLHRVSLPKSVTIARVTLSNGLSSTMICNPMHELMVMATVRVSGEMTGKASTRRRRGERVVGVPCAETKRQRKRFTGCGYYMPLHEYNTDASCYYT
jgi:hypothetical protein